MKLPPKDIKRSIREKYKRRVKWLAHAVEQFEFAAKDRLEEGGKIRNRPQTEELLEATDNLKALLAKYYKPEAEPLYNEDVFNIDIDSIFNPSSPD